MAEREPEFLPGPWSPDLPDWKIQGGGASYTNLDMIPQADRERERQQMMMQLRRRMMQNQNWTSMMPQARPTDEQALEYQKKIWPFLREPGWTEDRGYGQPSWARARGQQIPVGPGGSVTTELPGRDYTLNPVTQEEYEQTYPSGRAGPPVAMKGGR